MAVLNEQSIIDFRKVVSGKDGRLFINDIKGNPVFLGEVDTFKAQLKMNNTDYQPVGSALKFSVTLGYSFTLTMSEVVVRDDAVLNKVLQDLRDGFVPTFDFQGVLRRRYNGKVEEHRQVFRSCIPDGSVDLLNINPGEIVKRTWSFRVNALPEMMTMFN